MIFVCRRISHRITWTALRRTVLPSVAPSAPSLPGSGSGLDPRTQTPDLGFSPSRFLCSSPNSLILRFENTYISNRCHFSTQAQVDPPVGAIVEVPLAQTGEGIAECELLKWFVQEGDQVEEFQRLCEVQSDKATIEITSRYKGTVFQTLYGPGDIVKVGDTLLKILSEGIQTPTSDTLDNTTPLTSKTSDSDTQNLVCNKEKAEGVICTPNVRHLAKQYGININDVCGTGKDGRVLKEDVLKYAASKGMFTKSSEASEQLAFLKEEKSLLSSEVVDEWCYEDKTVPLRGFQRTMVKTMTMAAKVPHFHYLEEMNCNALVKLKAAFQNENTNQAIKHTYLPFLIKSLSIVLCKYPILNSSFSEETNELIIKGSNDNSNLLFVAGSHNIGVAMATSYGLVVPKIKKVQSLSILEITKELSRLHQLALNNKLGSEDISDGTITLSNIGAIGGKFGCPLLNLPEVAIIAIGRIQKLPRFADDGTLYPASIANVAIGADHRVVDGAMVATFCNEWKNLIEKPELLLLHMR